MSDEGLVSIIMPCYNASQFIEEAIVSVLNQTYTNWQLLIFDDSSTDGSPEIVQQYLETNCKISMVKSIENVGVAQSRNKALAEAKGDYIAFLDSDDVWLPHKLESQLSFMNSNGTLMTYSSYDVIDEHGAKQRSVVVPLSTNYDEMLKFSVIGTSMMIYNVKKLGKFYFHSIGHEDYLMKLELLASIGLAYGQIEVLGSYRIFESGVSYNKFRSATWQWNIYNQLGISFIRKVYLFSHYFWHGLSQRL